MISKHYDPGTGPAAQFMQSVAMTPELAKRLIVDSAKRVLAGDHSPVGPMQGRISLDVNHPDGRNAFLLNLDVSIMTRALADEVILAASHSLRIEPRYVISSSLIQARIVGFIKDCVVAQLFSSRDGQNLKLEIEKLPNARDLGNGVVALEKVGINVHTPLGSVRADERWSEPA